jgi:hypothetical protein
MVSKRIKVPSDQQLAATKALFDEDPNYPVILPYFSNIQPCPNCDCVLNPGRSAKVCDECRCHDSYKLFMAGPRHGKEGW